MDQQQTAEAPPERKDFLISYTDHDIAWAEWIGAQVEQAGYSTFLHAWDVRPGNNLILSLDRALRTRPGDLRTRYQIAAIYLSTGKVDEARKELEAVIQEAPKFPEAHVSLATAYYRLKRKEDGDRERALVLKLNEETQANQPKGQATGQETAK